jgi:tetratricopeptide (TPR) repeat protein
MFPVLRSSLVFLSFVFSNLALFSVPCLAQSTTTSQPAVPQVVSPASAATPALPAAAGTSAPNGAPPAAGAAVASAFTDANPLHTAMTLYRKGDFPGAIAKYEELLRERPHSPDAYAGMVRVYLKQKNIEQAAHVAEEGLAQSNSARIRVARGEVWFRQGKITDAEKEWVDVINSGYPEARAYLGLARVRDAIAMYKSSKNFLEKAHQLDPTDPDIQEAWIGTLSRADRIKYLKDSLAGENNWDADEREDLKSYLEFLTERAKQKGGSCRLVSKVTATETPLVRLLMDPEHLRGYGLSVTLNGHKSSLMLDTGAGGILIKRSLAEHAGISKITATKVRGIGDRGRKSAYFGVADSIKIGELEFQNCRVEVMESRSVAGEDGLIGADVFEDFLVDIDFPDEKLKLSQLPKRPGESEQKLALNSEDDDDDADADDANTSEPRANNAGDKTGDTAGNTVSDHKKDTNPKAQPPAPPSSGPQDRYIAPEMKSYTSVFRFGHDILVPTTIGKVPYKLFLIDTGALVNFISPAAAREITKVHGDSDTVVEGISGRVKKVYSADKAVLQFGHLRQENQDMTAFDTKPISDDIGTEVSGFLGFIVLRFLDMKIDYRDNLIDFKYDAKR